MNDILQETRDALDMFSGELVVGNHDSITLLGVEPQTKLRDYSKTVSKLFVKSNDELESAISDVVLEIEKFELRVTKKNNSFWSRENRCKKLTKEYNCLIAYIERVSLFFQMQQAQLLKENKLLEKLADTVRESIIALEQCIQSGEKMLCERRQANYQGENRLLPSRIDDSKEIDRWYIRLEHKLDDLRISHTASLQNQAQIKILYDNNLVLLDRIASAISNTFPIWQSQMTLILGIERMEKRLKDQEKVLRSSSHDQFDVEQIAALNNKLKSVLEETASLETKDVLIRKDLQEVVHHIERG